MMTEPTISCPTCRSEIKLTESLAAPIIQEMRDKFHGVLATKELEITAREENAARHLEAAERAKASFEERLQGALAKARLEAEQHAAQAMKKSADAQQEQVALLVEELKNGEEVRRGQQAAYDNALAQIEAETTARIAAERKRIAAEESEKARLIAAADLAQTRKQLDDLGDVLKDRDEKLAAAQAVQVDFLKKQRSLDDSLRELELTVEKRVQDDLAGVREKAKKDAEDSLKLKVSEKEEQISSMQRQIEELRRRAEQGSQQLQGEVLELELETVLKQRFPHDAIERVGKGEFGGDIVQIVINPHGARCGSILWETKRTKNWNDGWLPKLRDDQRNAKADVAIIVSNALPKGIATFDIVDDVWIAEYRCALPVAACLRQSLVELAAIRHASLGQHTKTELVYQYLTGPRFKQRVQAIVEKFSDMSNDLDKERRMMMKNWAKRETQIKGVIDATSGMYGDLQGIAGGALVDIEALNLPLLTSAVAA